MSTKEIKQLVGLFALCAVLIAVGASEAWWSFPGVMVLSAVTIAVVFVLDSSQGRSGTFVEPLERFELPSRPLNPVDFDAHDVVTELRDVGFSDMGAVRFTLPDHAVVFSLLLSPDQRTYAVLSPKHLTFVSDYEGKVFVTASKSDSAPLPFELVQAWSNKSTAELLAEHEAAIEQIRVSLGRMPRGWRGPEAVDAYVAMERYGLETIRVVPQVIAGFRSLFGSRRRDPLASGAETAIRSWFTSRHSYRAA